MTRNKNIQDLLYFKAIINFNKYLKKKDVVNISVDTTKQDELFDYVGYERYYGASKYNELDNDYDKNADFGMSLQ